MINFNGDSIWNLKPIDVSSVKTQVFGLLIEGEEIVAAFRTIRDQLVFTNKRIISIDVQGLTGLKKSFAIMPYSKVQFFTIQTPGFAHGGGGWQGYGLRLPCRGAPALWRGGVRCGG